MTSTRVRSKTGCLTCKNRRKKCDEKHPICDRCVRAGIECLGYSYLDLPKEKSVRPRTKATPHALSRSSLGPASPSRPQPQTLPTPATASPYPFLPATPSAWNDLSLEAPASTIWPSAPCGFPSDFPSADTGPIPSDVLDFSFLPDSTTNTIFDSQHGANNWWEANLSHAPPVNGADQTPNFTTDLLPNQMPLTPAPTPDSGNYGLVPFRGFGPPTSTSATRLTAGQASLLQSLLSLGQPHNDSPEPTRSTCETPSSRGSSWPSPDLELDDESSVTSDESDPEGVVAMIRAPVLNSNLESNSLPFVLHSYAKWITQTVYEPLRMVHKARDWITSRYNNSEDSRQIITLAANVIRFVAKDERPNQAYQPSMSLLQDRVRMGIALASSRQNLSHDLEHKNSIEAINHALEVSICHCQRTYLHLADS
ncbi:hypothetical protein BDV93DRAFT_358496 [Ceratobasidium sp. AG-I]|nr:hypothetical protein BDV93DRAFT_358496 [Ceratobasidium sp. AG-I]